MDERELPSDSDSSDEDFVPDGADSDLPSEEESGPEDAELEAGGDSADEANNKKVPKGRKRVGKKKCGGRKKRPKKDEEENVEKEEDSEDKKAEQEEMKKLTEEEEKEKADSLWADFMKDVGGPPPRKSGVGSTKIDTPENSSTVAKSASPRVTTPSSEKENKAKDVKVTITKVFEFAGEEVRVTKEVSADSAEARLVQPQTESPGSQASEGGTTSRGRGRGGGLSGISSVLSQIGKKAKISTLEKSKLDWDQYKQDQGIEEEIQTHNRGKGGYLEKQDFLQRADLRQFEIEKQMRASRRSNR